MSAGLTAAVKVRLEPALRAELEELAAEAGVPVSMLVRNLIRNHLAKLREAERS